MFKHSCLLFCSDNKGCMLTVWYRCSWRCSAKRTEADFVVQWISRSCATLSYFRIDCHDQEYWGFC